MHQRLRDLRMMLRLTQYDTAKLSGVGRTRLSLFENGHIELQAAELNAISRALEKAAGERVSVINSISAAGALSDPITA